MENLTEEKLVEAGAKIWEKGSIKRAYLNDDAIINLFGFKKVERPKWAGEFNGIGKAKVFYDLNKNYLASDTGMVRVMFNRNGVKCSK